MALSLLIFLSLFLYQGELDKIFQTLQLLKEKKGNSIPTTIASRIAAIQDAFNSPSSNNGFGDGAGNKSSSDANNKPKTNGKAKQVSMHLQNGQIVNCDSSVSSSSRGPVIISSGGAGLGGALVVAETAALAAVTTITPMSPGDDGVAKVTTGNGNKSQKVLPKSSRISEEPSSSVSCSRRSSRLAMSPTASCRSEEDMNGLKRRLEDGLRSLSNEPNSCMSSCRSSRCCSSSDCSFCSRRCSYSGTAGPGEGLGSSGGNGEILNCSGLVNSCSLGSECTYKNDRSKSQRPRKRSMNIQTDLMSSPDCEASAAKADHLRHQPDGGEATCQAHSQNDELSSSSPIRPDSNCPTRLHMHQEQQHFSGNCCAKETSFLSAKSNTLKDPLLGDAPEPMDLDSVLVLDSTVLTGAEILEEQETPNIELEETRHCSGMPRRQGGKLGGRKREGSSAAEEDLSHDTRSGHAKTHRIVINLDDKNRFTEEVTV